MLEMLGRNWGWVALRGIIAMLFGVLTLFHPGITLTVLVMLFGAYALADGSFMVIAALTNRHGEPRWIGMLLGGSLGVTVGVATLTWPAITGLALLVIMAAWAFLIGVLEVVAAARLRTVITDEWVLVVSGLLAIIFGATLVLQPDTSALVMALMIGVYAIASGTMLIVLGVRLRRTFHPVAP